MAATLQWSRSKSHVPTESLPDAFTEHGAIMVAITLSSAPAIDVSVYVVRVFVRIRELATTHGNLAKRLAELTQALAMNQDTFSRNTRAKQQVIDALRELMTPPDPPQRPIGFINPEDNCK